MRKFFFDSTWNRLLERVWQRKVKKPVDYLYLKWGEKEFGRICVKECNVAGMNTLEISFVPSGRKKGETDIWGEREAEQWKNRLKRKLRFYNLESCVVNGDWSLLNAFGIENVGFKARKKELLIQGMFIFKQLCPRREKETREKLLIFLESEAWEPCELYNLLWIAKNYYEDIVLASENISVYKETLACLFEECGLVVTTINLKKAEMEIYDSVLFLVKKWQLWYTEKICYRRAYVVAEWDEPKVWLRRKVKGDMVTDVPVCFSGLCYECNGRKIPYQFATDIFYQNSAFYDEKGISFVAIYRLECYNNNNYAGC